MIRSFLKKFSRSRPESPSPPAEKIEDGPPSAGAVFSFKTEPLWEFSPADTGRFAAFKVLGCDSRYVAVAVLDRVWRSPPTLAQTRGVSILCQHRFAHTGRQAVFGVNRDWWEPAELNDLRRLGEDSLSTEETVLADKVARDIETTVEIQFRTLCIAQDYVQTAIA